MPSNCILVTLAGGVLDVELVDVAAEASLSSADSSIDSRSLCAAMNERRSGPSMEGGISVPELLRSCAAFSGAAVDLSPADVAALTAEPSKA